MSSEGVPHVTGVSSRVSKLIQELQRSHGAEISDRVVRRGSSAKIEMPSEPLEPSESPTFSSRRTFFGRDNRVLFHKISPTNRRWLLLYKVVLNSGVALLVVAYTFYILGLFEPILYLDAGEFTDAEVFQPFYETLPHSLSTLYRQESYFTVAVASIFSLVLPFVKMFVTAVAYVAAVRHRRTQLLLFFGEKPIDKSGIRQEDEGAIKYAREMLIMLKLVSKFQMVDVIVLLLNAVFLRCAFVWARLGQGLLFLIIYCLLSIVGAQMINFAVEGEKAIFDTWYAIKYAIVPPELSIRSSNSLHGNDAMSDSSNSGYSEKRWFVSEGFICLMAGFNILSCISLMSNEKLLTVAFTMDSRKVLAVDSTTMSYSEIMVNLHRMDYGPLSVVILFFLCIIFPMIFTLLFLACIFGYNYCKRNSSEPLTSVEIAESSIEEPRLEYEWDVRYTRLVFKLCNIVSEWSCGEVVSLGTIAAFTSMTTADRVLVSIPPKHTCSALFMMVSYGLSSFLLTACFYIWNQNAKFEFSHIRIYVKYLESPNPGYRERLMSDNQLTDDQDSDHLVTPATSNQRRSAAPPAVNNFFLPYLEFLRGVFYSRWFTSVFFGLLAGITLLFLMSAYTLSYPAPYVNVKATNHFLQNDLHEVFGLIMKQVPESYGQCDFAPHPAPLPCSGSGPLFVTENKLHLSCMWISGLKSATLQHAAYYFSVDRRMTFNVRLHVAKISAYLRIAAVEDGNLRNMLAGVVSTEGDGFSVEVQLSLKCIDRSPQIRDLRADGVTVTGFRALGKLFTVGSKFFDIPQAIGRWCTDELNKVLSNPRQVIMWRGVSFDLAELINLIAAQNWPTSFVCPAPEL
ncbi:uncharacterized protein BcabD6B2_18490 [Babesia caballi]|uniref:Membrane protein, putative n=1 Tax=Babesia caballi TaxID=5871 RepID=A0AAV4LUU6_BABCB|nr:membrane protein, putative [Babesia caballi]